LVRLGLAIGIAVKPASDPAMPSAKVIAASLPDWMTRPRIKSSTRTWLCTSRNVEVE